MTIRDFEIFIAVAETGQMGVASRKLYITQPTVSHAIMQIEKEYHVKLFERLSKKLYITETGREFLEYARHITATYHEMEQFLYHASSQQCIHIGASLTVGSFFLSDIITGYEAENPNVNIRVYIDNSMNIIRKISEGTLDVAVIEGNVKTKDVIFKDIFEDEMVLICGKTVCGQVLHKPDGFGGEGFCTEGRRFRYERISYRSHREQRDSDCRKMDLPQF